jgi:prepilin-type processing-associated H-X9-DG protein
MKDYPREEIDPLYIEYWFNDWQGLKDRDIEAISGNHISRIPLPHLTVLMSDAVWEGKGFQYTVRENAKVARHSGGLQIVFVDGHVSSYRVENYLDTDSLNFGTEERDCDLFGNTPFWMWGASREGYDGLHK